MVGKCVATVDLYLCINWYCDDRNCRCVDVPLDTLGGVVPINGLVVADMVRLFTVIIYLLHFSSLVLYLSSIHGLHLYQRPMVLLVLALCSFIG